MATAGVKMEYEQVHCGHDGPIVLAFSVGQKRQFLLCGLCYAMLKGIVLEGIIQESVNRQIGQAMGRMGYVRGRK